MIREGGRQRAPLPPRLLSSLAYYLFPLFSFSSSFAVEFDGAKKSSSSSVVIASSTASVDSGVDSEVSPPSPEDDVGDDDDVEEDEEDDDEVLETAETLLELSGGSGKAKGPKQGETSRA